MKNSGRGAGAELAFVSTWAIKRGHRNIQEAEVDGELCAMMNHMVQDHAPDTCHARHGENRLAASKQRPALHHVRVAGASQCSSRLGDVFVENGQGIVPTLNFGKLERRAIYGGDVE